MLAALRQARSVYDIFVVDEGSADGTAEAAQNRGRVSTMRLHANVGKGGDVWDGS